MLRDTKNDVNGHIRVDSDREKRRKSKARWPQPVQE
jgi:hypothetical protein